MDIFFHYFLVVSFASVLWSIIYVYNHYAPSLVSVAHKAKILNNTVGTC